MMNIYYSDFFPKFWIIQSAGNLVGYPIHPAVKIQLVFHP